MSALWLTVAFAVGLAIGGVVSWILRNERIRALSEQLDDERENADERIRSVRQTEEQVREMVKAIGADLLASTRGELSKANAQQLESASEKAKLDLDHRKDAIAKVVEPVKEQLTKLEQQITKLDKARGEDKGRIETLITSLNETTSKLTAQTNELSTRMRGTSSRGQWGQIQLRRVVEMAGMMEHVHFAEQRSIEGQDGQRLRPDLVVDFAGDKELGVDAKNPAADLIRRADSAESEAERSGLLKEYSKGVKKHVDELAGREYAAALRNSLDFVVLFLPSEDLIAAAIAGDAGLAEYAMSKRVLITTPTTLLALLYAVAYGWQQEAVAASAREIADLGKTLHERIAKLSDQIMGLGGSFKTAITKYNNLVSSFNNTVPAAREFSRLGAGSSSQIKTPRVMDDDVKEHRQLKGLDLSAYEATGTAGPDVTEELGISDLEDGFDAEP